MSETYGCENCGGPTENEPMTICDECEEAIRAGEKHALSAARQAGAEAAEAEVARLRVLWKACLENKEGLRLGEDVCAALNDLSDFEAANRLLDGRGE